jgi:hypothetical protein
MKRQNPRGVEGGLRRVIPALATVFLLLLPLTLATPSQAFGYADPGTGAFVYQAAYALFLGGSFYLRKLLDRIWSKRK